MKNEVLPFADDSWVNDKKTVVGYEVSFTKYFYKPLELRSMSEIVNEIKSLDLETSELFQKIIGGDI